MEVIFIIVCVFVLIYAISKASNPNNKRDRSNNTNQPSRRAQQFRQSKKSYSTNPDKFWITKNTSKTIKGYKIEDGLLYVGTNLANVDNEYWAEEEPALINPKLSVDKYNPDYSGDTISYWPFYSKITPQARAAYLEWLANGRKSSDTQISYVFLYFYGLERRLLNGHYTKPSKEKELLVKEIQRLLSIYGANRSFKKYATGLLDFVSTNSANKKNLKDNIRKEDLSYSNYINELYDYRINFKKGLAYFAINGNPLPPLWALKWAYVYMRKQGLRLRTPAVRCKEKFSELFKAEYKNKFGHGYKLKPNKTFIKLSYQPASRTFGHVKFNKETKIPDLTNRTKPVKDFVKLVKHCTDKLDSYSRYIGRNQNDTDSTEALSNLPSDLLNNYLTPELKQLTNDLKEELQEKNYTLLNSEVFRNYWNVKGINRFREKESIEIAQFFFKLGFGMEPDLRFGSAKFERNGQVVFFKIDSENHPIAPSKEYNLALLVLQLTTVLSLADGAFSENEEKQLNKYIKKLFQLSPVENKRLNAYLFWLKNENPGLHGIKKKIKEIEFKKRKSILDFLIKIANADNYVSPEEVTLLQKISGIFDLDPDQIYKDIHSQQANSSSPVLVVKGEKPNGYSIPKKEIEKESSSELDEKDVKKVLDDTKQVQDILGEIFEEEAAEPEPPPQPNTKNTLLGLDNIHSDLVSKLLTKDEWTKLEYENLCSEFDLFPGGAKEIINDNAFEKYDDALILDFEEIEINSEIANEIKP